MLHAISWCCIIWHATRFARRPGFACEVVQGRSSLCAGIRYLNGFERVSFWLGWDQSGEPFYKGTKLVKTHAMVFSICSSEPSTLGSGSVKKKMSTRVVTWSMFYVALLTRSSRRFWASKIEARVQKTCDMKCRDCCDWWGQRRCRCWDDEIEWLPSIVTKKEKANICTHVCCVPDNL